uniref:Uncharacterized protein n=1 Tax=Anguilla anguilla TaxID=7936 RepID=A0A0E9QQ26_ANGAN
MKAGHCSQNV